MELKSKTIIFACLFSLIFRTGYPQDLSLRAVSLKVAVDEEFRRKKTWRIDVKGLVADASRIYEEKFGIKLDVHSIQPWYSNDSQYSMHTLLKDLRQKVSHNGCDIVVGLTAQYNLKNDLLGVASYLNSCVLLRKVNSSLTMRGMLLHELSHLFGAIDLNENGSIMGNGTLVEEFDEFSSRVIFLNKHR